MKDNLIQYFSKFTRLTEPEIEALKESMNIVTFKKGTYVLREGQTNADSYFVLEGLLRQCKSVDGDDISTNFFVENDWIISMNSFSDNKTVSEDLICLEDCTLVIGNEEKAQKLFKQFPRLETISRAVMESVFAEHQKQLSHYLTESPEQRYIRLVQTKPGIVQRVKQYQIASYLGIKPESLSRIRKRMMQSGI
ncbi:MAG TPA: Crp/Fnr family transcriptional regulator [Bacteroidia bacterium]